MSQTKRFVLLAGAALSVGGVNAALAQQEQSSDEVRAMVAEMLADAQNRSNLLAGGGAGHDGRFFLADQNGNFRLNVGGQIQFRYYLNWRDDANTAGIQQNDEFNTGFQTRRTKLSFDGNIFNPNWTYRIVGAFDRADGNFGLEDAFIGYNFGNGWKAKWGQFKLPFLREELVSSKYQLAVDRSTVNEIFNQDYSQGMELRYEANDWRFMAAFSDGFASRNSDFPNASTVAAGNVGQADWALTGRFEYKFAGDWKDFEDFTAESGQAFGGLLGAAIHYQDSANTSNPADVDLQYLTYTFDASFEGDGWNVYGAFVGAHTDSRGPVGSGNNPDFDDFGAVIQGGYRFAKDTELFARYDGVFLDSDRALTGDTDFHFLTIGLNQYYAGHAAKASIDAVYSFNETTNLAGFTPTNVGGGFPNGGFPSTGTGLLGDSENGEVVIRLQFQLLF